MSAIINLLLAIASLAKGAFEFFARKREQEIGANESKLRGLENAKQGQEVADVARQDIRNDAIARPDKLRDDDGFKRPSKRK